VSSVDLVACLFPYGRPVAECFSWVVAVGNLGFWIPLWLLFLGSVFYFWAVDMGV